MFYDSYSYMTEVNRVFLFQILCLMENEAFSLFRYIESDDEYFKL